MLKYKDHDYSPECACCVADADAAYDPTGTSMLRSNYARRMDSLWRQFDAALRKLIVEQDVLGLGADAITSAAQIIRQGHDPAARLSGFDNAICMLIRRFILFPQLEMAGRFIDRAAKRGEAFGRKNTPDSYRGSGAPLKTPQRAGTRRETALKAAMLDLAGVGSAVRAQLGRLAGQAMAGGERPPVLMTKLHEAILKIGVQRSRLMTEDVIIRTFTNAALDVYESFGIDALGVIPEHIVPKVIEDAKTRQMRRGAGSKVSRKQTPSRSTIYRIRKQEERLETLGKVNVKTAGDKLVCPVCKSIARRGPYTINRARQLIPAHPRCRCIFVPVDKRIKKNSK